MGGFSIWHWLIVLFIIILVFGTKKIRNLGKDLGGAVHDFKEGLNEQSVNPENKKIDGNVIEHRDDDFRA